MTVPAALNNISNEKKKIIRNLFDSGITEEFIAMQLDIDVHMIIHILDEEGAYNSSNRFCNSTVRQGDD